MFILIDCDNFFVSCERIFQPRLRNRPVVVLSNNDGCVIARSPEAKAVGIAMCSPFFKIENLLKLNDGVALSSNYELYADISSRVMNLLRSRFGCLEIYSIDEAFAQIRDTPDLFALAGSLRRDILQQIGIPVSIGIARTKTLCKIAASLAKRNFSLCRLTEPEMIKETLAETEIGNIWRIGRKTASKLNFLGIFTALDLINAPLPMLRQKFGISLEKTVLELRQIPCLSADDGENRQSVISSGSFEFEIRNKDKLLANLAEFTDCACLRLRQMRALASGIWVELHSNRFNRLHPQYNSAVLISLDQPGDNTAAFISAASRGLEQIYRPDCWYKRAGVTLIGLEKRGAGQTNWLTDAGQTERDRRLMKAFDCINNRFGRHTVYFAVQPKRPRAFLKRDLKSPAYTTDWNQLLRVS